MNKAGQPRGVAFTRFVAQDKKRLVLFPVFSGLVKVIVTALCQLMRCDDGPDDDNEYYPKDDPWLHDVILARISREGSPVSREKLRVWLVIIA